MTNREEMVILSIIKTQLKQARSLARLIDEGQIVEDIDGVFDEVSSWLETKKRWAAKKDEENI